MTLITLAKNTYHQLLMTMTEFMKVLNLIFPIQSKKELKNNLKKNYLSQLL